MTIKNAQQSWHEYCETELESVTPTLQSLGVTLDEKQPHLGGERFLMQAVTTTSGRKLILLGTYKGKRSVIKVTRDPSGKNELNHERTCRTVLARIKFAHGVFVTPPELLFTERGAFLISVQTYIPQEKPFLERPTREQFTFALSAFKAQEGAHATTYEHEKLITNTFGMSDAQSYLDRFEMFKNHACAVHNTHACVPLFEEAGALLTAHRETLERYSGFLTHTDFVPHNFRIHDGTMYLLDHSSLRFGNKYEGWARFINFMALYNPELSAALIEYVHNNRTAEESLALKLMRLYRLGEIIYYYTNTLAQSTGSLLKLNTARVDFWTEVLRATLKDTLPSAHTIAAYQSLRDSLRSDDEKERQRDLH